MRIAVICGGYKSLYSGNFIPSLRYLKKRLLDYDVEMIWVFDKSVEKRLWYKQLIDEGEKVELIDFGTPLLHRIHAIDKIIRKYKIRLIHVHFGDKIAPTLSVYFKPWIKVIWHIHSDWSLGKDSKKSLKIYIKGMLRSIFELRVKRIVVSEKLKKKRDTYIPNGIATERIINLSPLQRTSTRLEVGIQESVILIMLFAWEPVVKGADIAVNAIKILRAANKKIELAIVTDEAEGTRHYIKDKCGECAFIHFLSPTENVFAYYGIADIFLSASRSEGFPYSICEALAVGKPCVISDIPGCKWAKEFKSVKFFKTEDSENCAAAIEELLMNNDETQYLELLRKDSKLICEKYSIEKWADAVIQVYDF